MHWSARATHMIGQSRCTSRFVAHLAAARLHGSELQAHEQVPHMEVDHRLHFMRRRVQHAAIGRKLAACWVVFDLQRDVRWHARDEHVPKLVAASHAVIVEIERRRQVPADGGGPEM